MQAMAAIDIRSVIHRAEPELRAAGLSALYLFGSHARGDSREDSDIDLAFDVADNSDFNLFDQGRLQNRLEELLGRKVDFLERDAIHPDLRPRIERDLVRVF